MSVFVENNKNPTFEKVDWKLNYQKIGLKFQKFQTLKIWKMIKFKVLREQNVTFVLHGSLLSEIVTNLDNWTKKTIKPDFSIFENDLTFLNLNQIQNSMLMNGNVKFQKFGKI